MLSVKNTVLTSLDKQVKKTPRNIVKCLLHQFAVSINVNLWLELGVKLRKTCQTKTCN